MHIIMSFDYMKLWIIRGVQPNLSAQQIMQAIHSHDQQQLDEAVTAGARPRHH